jgi:NAD(P)-dependent dehydrogenase (short-subunit alcohol dehydrogenase family)
MKPTILVTGGGTGIGKATALAFAREGARVIVAGRRLELLQAAAREIEVAGGTARAVAADISREEGAARLGSAVDAFGGELDVLVNNAGLFRAAPFLESKVSDHWHSLLETNLTGMFLVTRELTPYLLRSPRGHLFNVLSVAALRGFSGNAGYCASKWGARGLTEALRAEYQEKLRITAMFPGATDTDAWNGAAFPHDRSKMLRPETVAAAMLAAWNATPAPTEIILETPPGSVG